jgi:hypothetical protein
LKKFIRDGNSEAAAFCITHLVELLRMNGADSRHDFARQFPAKTQVVRSLAFELRVLGLGLCAPATGLGKQYCV